MDAGPGPRIDATLIRPHAAAMWPLVLWHVCLRLLCTLLAVGRAMHAECVCAHHGIWHGRGGGLAVPLPRLRPLMLWRHPCSHQRAACLTPEACPCMHACVSSATRFVDNRVKYGPGGALVARSLQDVAVTNSAFYNNSAGEGRQAGGGGGRKGRSRAGTPTGWQGWGEGGDSEEDA